MTQPPQSGKHPTGPDDRLPIRHEPGEGLRLVRKMLLYHFVIAALLMTAAVLFPSFVDILPIGGVRALAEGGDATVSVLGSTNEDSEDIEVISSLAQAGRELDRLGYARQLTIVLIGVWLLMLPVSWVRRHIDKDSAKDHSLDETTLVLPGVVAAIVLVVQHSLALAFSLAGIVAGVHFRRALQDTFDALFILVAIGTGIAAGVEALEIAAVLTVFFAYATVYVYFLGDGLESDYAARKKKLKSQRAAAAAAAKEPPDQGGQPG